jgi:hypothetical protein
VSDENPHGEGDDRLVQDHRGTPGVDPEAAEQPAVEDPTPEELDQDEQDGD